MAGKYFEIEIKATDEHNRTDTKRVEYQAVSATTPKEATEEFYKGLMTHSRARCREIVDHAQ